MARPVGSKHPITPPHRSHADPPHPEGARYCFACGVPEQPGKLRVYPGLWGYIRFHVDLALCERCVSQAAMRDPRQSDPLTLDDVA